MFKGTGSTWVYMIGIVIMFAILITLGSSYILPVIFGEKEFDPQGRFNTPPDFKLDTDKDYLAVIKTNFGNITVDLYEDNAPNNVNNYVHLSSVNYYNGTKFHRLIPGLLVQGGDRNTLDDDLSNDGKGNPGYVLNDEINWESLALSDDKKEELNSEGYTNDDDVESKALESLTLVMANGGPNTNGSQFFIVIASPQDSRLEKLNGRFTVIGTVIEGGEVLDNIANIPVDNPNLKSPRPTQDIIIDEVDIFTR